MGKRVKSDQNVQARLLEVTVVKVAPDTWRARACLCRGPSGEGAAHPGLGQPAAILSPSFLDVAGQPAEGGDDLGSTSKLVKEDGILPAGGVRLYKPWGELRYESGGEVGTKYRYTGQYEEFEDSKNELYNYGRGFTTRF